MRVGVTMAKTLRKRPGPRSFYRPKDAPAKTMMLTKLGKEILREAHKRTGESEADIVEWLLRKHGREVVFDRDSQEQMR